MKEQDFQKAIIDLGRTLGYKVAHFRSVRVQRKDGSTYYATPVQADGEGWLDLSMVRPPRIIMAELKSASGRLTAEQKVWVSLWQQCPGIEVYVWCPKDWDEIERMLKG